MPQQAQSSLRISGGASRSRTGLLQLFGLGAMSGVAGFFAPNPQLADALFFAGIGLMVVAAMVAVSDIVSVVRADRWLRTVAGYAENDAAATFTTDGEGAITYMNAAAIERFGEKLGATPVAVLAGLFASTAAVLYRLQRKADSVGAGREDVAMRRGHLRLSVHKIGEGYLWRAEDLSERGIARGAESISLPMLTVSKSGTILYMNEALRQLTGGRHKALDRIVTDLPVRHGQVHEIATSAGTQRATVVEIPVSAGRREIYILPLVTGLSDLDWGIADALPVPLVTLLPDGSVRQYNRQARDLLKIEPGEETAFAWLVEGLGRPVHDWVADAAEGRHTGKPEFLRVTRAAQDMFVQVALSPYQYEGETAVLGVLNDATELKSLEAQFVQSQKMQAIGQLAGGVAHDFNNLLTAISGHCDLLLLRRDVSDPDFADLEQINQNANRAAALVGQLLAFSRKQTLRPEALELRDLMGEITHLLNRLVGEKISLDLIFDPEAKLVRADRRQFEQVLMNLVVNARDAMPEGGRIEIETRMTMLKSEMRRDRAIVPPGEYVLIQVRDQGIGIDAENLSKIFEPFYTTKRAGEGTGLGLSTVYGIVKQSGGYIFAESTPGQGTAFTMYFPAQAQGAKAAAPAALPQPERPSVHGGDGVVLLVEDEAPVRAFASRALQLRGYTVIEAASAEEALEKLGDATLEVDVFVTDVIMPGKDGPTWVAEALEDRPETRVVFVSGYAEESFSDGQSRIEGSVFLPKPFSLSQLTETVDAQLN